MAYFWNTLKSGMRGFYGEIGRMNRGGGMSSEEVIQSTCFAKGSA